jgi:hypothetical protein
VRFCELIHGVALDDYFKCPDLSNEEIASKQWAFDSSQNTSRTPERGVSVSKLCLIISDTGSEYHSVVLIIVDIRKRMCQEDYAEYFGCSRE